MNYTADSLHYIPENKSITLRYKDLIKPKVIDNRSADEIVLDVMLKGGLRFEE